jgi:hypothetical protein
MNIFLMFAILFYFIDLCCWIRDGLHHIFFSFAKIIKEKYKRDLLYHITKNHKIHYEFDIISGMLESDDDDNFILDKCCLIDDDIFSKLFLKLLVCGYNNCSEKIIIQKNGHDIGENKMPEEIYNLADKHLRDKPFYFMCFNPYQSLPEESIKILKDLVMMVYHEHYDGLNFFEILFNKITKDNAYEYADFMDSVVHLCMWLDDKLKTRVKEIMIRVGEKFLINDSNEISTFWKLYIDKLDDSEKKIFINELYKKYDIYQ